MKTRFFALVNTILATALLTAFLAAMVVSAGEYDPWLDTDDSGKIDMRDIGALARAFGTAGDPTRNVTVTNWPTATLHLTALLNESQSSANIGGKLVDSSEIIGIGGKTIFFMSGGVSGGVTWNTIGQGSNQMAAGGGSPGAGRVEVYDPSNNLLAVLALPLNSMFIVQNVSKIKVIAEAPIPSLTTFPGSYASSYSAFVAASVYWTES